MQRSVEMLEKEKRDRELKKYNDKKKREWEETIREKIRIEEKEREHYYKKR